MKKVLYISYDGLTDPLGQSQVLPYLSGLSRQGFRFTIISFEKKNRFEREEGIVRPIIEAGGMQWNPVRFTANPPVLSKIYDRWKLKQVAINACRKDKFDIVHCRSYVAAEVGLMLKKRFGLKFLFDMRGFWADEKVDNGQWNQDHLFYKLLYKHYKKKEKQFLLNADGIITLTHAAQAYLLAKEEYRHLSITVIPCCADLGLFNYHNISREQISELKQRLRIPASARVICYSGSTGGWYMSQEMFHFFRILVEKHPDYVMLFLTKDDAEKVKANAGKAGVTLEKLFVTYANHDQLPTFLALSTIGIFFIRNTFSKMASSPTKHAELMGMGIPVICNDIGDTGQIVRDTGTGIVNEEFSSICFQKTIEKINDIEKVNKEYIRDQAKQLFDLETGVQRYLNSYNRMLRH